MIQFMCNTSSFRGFEYVGQNTHIICKQGVEKTRFAHNRKEIKQNWIGWKTVNDFIGEMKDRWG